MKDDVLRHTSAENSQQSPCEVFYLEQDVSERSAVLLAMAIGLPCCQPQIDVVLSAGTIKLSKKRLIEEARRRLRLRQGASRYIHKPGSNWNVAQIKRWLREHPIQGAANIQFVCATIESINYGLNESVGEPPPYRRRDGGGVSASNATSQVDSAFPSVMRLKSGGNDRVLLKDDPDNPERPLVAQAAASNREDSTFATDLDMKTLMARALGLQGCDYQEAPFNQYRKMCQPNKKLLYLECTRRYAVFRIGLNKTNRHQYPNPKSPKETMEDWLRRNPIEDEPEKSTLIGLVTNLKTELDAEQPGVSDLERAAQKTRPDRDKRSTALQPNESLDERTSPAACGCNTKTKSHDEDCNAVELERDQPTEEQPETTRGMVKGQLKRIDYISEKAPHRKPFDREGLDCPVSSSEKDRSCNETQEFEMDETPSVNDIDWMQDGRWLRRDRSSDMDTDAEFELIDFRVDAGECMPQDSTHTAHDGLSQPGLSQPAVPETVPARSKSGSISSLTAFEDSQAFSTTNYHELMKAETPVTLLATEAESNGINRLVELDSASILSWPTESDEQPKGTKGRADASGSHSDSGGGCLGNGKHGDYSCDPHLQASETTSCQAHERMSTSCPRREASFGCTTDTMQATNEGKETSAAGSLKQSFQAEPTTFPWPEFVEVFIDDQVDRMETSSVASSFMKYSLSTIDSRVLSDRSESDSGPSTMKSSQDYSGLTASLKDQRRMRGGGLVTVRESDVVSTNNIELDFQFVANSEQMEMDQDSLSVLSDALWSISLTNDREVILVKDRSLMDRKGKMGIYYGTCLSPPETRFRPRTPHGTGVMEYTSGVIYDGEWCNGFWNGYGKLEYAKNNYYAGDFEKTIPTGQGLRVWPDGSEYEGGWKDGKRSGKGTYRSPAGDVFEGNWLKDRLAGKGRCQYSNGDTYKGEYLNGAREGNGSFKWANGDSYEGQYVADRRSGFGQYVWANGSEYRGDWKNGKKHGEGLWTSPDGHEFKGPYQNGAREGQGRYKWPDGSFYEGTYVKGLKQGSGRRCWPDGSEYVGEFVAGLQKGQCEYRDHRGRKYKGEWVSQHVLRRGSRYSGLWKNDKPFGFGKCHYRNGDIYEGQYYNGKQHGHGCYTYADSSRYNGTFVAGLPQGAWNRFLHRYKLLSNRQHMHRSHCGVAKQLGLFLVLMICLWGCAELAVLQGSVLLRFLASTSVRNSGRL